MFAFSVFAGKKKDGKDGDDSDKETDRRRSRDRRSRRRDNDDENDSKKDDNNDESRDDKNEKTDQSEDGKSNNGDQSDSEKDDDSSKDNQSISSDITSVNEDDSHENNSVDLERSKVMSPSCEGGDLGVSKCKNSSQNQSQSPIGGHITSSNDDVVMSVSVASDTVGAIADSRNNCDSKSRESLAFESHTPPNGLIVPTSSSSSSSSSNPSSSSVCSSPSLGSSNSSKKSPIISELSSQVSSVTSEKSFKLPNGALHPVIASVCKTTTGSSVTTSSHITSASVSRFSNRQQSSHTAVSSPSRNVPSSQSLKRSYSPPRGATALHSRVASCGVVPYKKPRSSYLGSSLGSSLDIRGSLLSSSHLALTPNSIPGFAALQPPIHHLATDTISPSSQLSAAMMRPVMPTRGATSISSHLPSYGSPYGAVQSYQGQVAQVGQVAQGSYPYQYQSLASSDLSSLPSLQSSIQRTMIHPYYPSGVTTPQVQQTLLTQTGAAPSSDLLTPDLLTSDLASYLSSKDLAAQHMSMKYASSIPTSLPTGGYQYQAISIQAMNSNPAYQTSAVSPFTSTPSPPYLSLSGPQNGATVPALPTATAITPSVPLVTPMVTDEPKLDPVSQAVYDNVLGKLPLKRKREIPCTPCGLIFNSEAQATAHFSGIRHLKKQKVSDDGEGGEEITGTYRAYYRP